MRIAVVSDLHLGAGDATERCVHSDATLLAWFDELEACHEQVFLLGDVWETLTDPALPGASRRALDQARRAHSGLAARFERPVYRHFTGNHDPVTRALGAREHVVLDLHGDRYLFLHGDVLDPHLRPWLTDLGLYLGGWLLRMGLEETFRAFEAGVAHRDEGEGAHPGDASPFQRAALAMAERTGADVIVTGHTHLACILGTGRAIYANSGAALSHEVSWLSLDTRTGRIERCRRLLTRPDDRPGPSSSLAHHPIARLVAAALA